MTIYDHNQEQSMRELTYTAAAREALTEEMERNPAIFVMGEGIGARGGNFNTTAGLYERFGPTRLCDTPIAERGFVGLATGAAMTGSRPVVDFMFFDFILDSMGEMINQMAKIQYMSSGRLKMPIVLRGCIGVGGASATHHSGNYYPIFAHLPGFKVAIPYTPADAKGLFKTALQGNDPVLFLEHKSLLSMKGLVPDGEHLVPFGKANVLREGTHITVVSLCLMLKRTLDAAEKVSQEGISVEVIDPRTINPLDMATIRESVRKTGRLLVVDETFAPCGIGAEIAAQMMEDGFDDLDAPVRRVNGAYTHIPYSPPLEAAVVPNQGQIEQAIRALVAE
jgi:2-oxoisovalerate dehydrogenase E1 component